MKVRSNKKIFIQAVLLALFWVNVAWVPASADPGEDHEEKEGHAVFLSQEESEEFGVRLETAGPGIIGVTLSLTGEVQLNRDRLANVVSMLPGVITEIKKYIGDHVVAGEVMAVLNSRELADMKSEYLAAKERTSLAMTVFEREKILWKKKISSQKDFLEAEQALKEAEIALVSAEQKLMALGFSKKDIESLNAAPGNVLARYEIKAPITGTVIEKHVALGEAVTSYGGLYKIADLSTVWVDLDVYQKDLYKIRIGQKVLVKSVGGQLEANGEISYMEPVLSEATRTATARVILENPTGDFRPGLFVKAMVNIDERPVKLRILKTALQYLDGAEVVFVHGEHGLEPRKVRLGLSNNRYAEVVSGLSPGERYVVNGAFILKSELEKESFGGEGHAH